MSGSIVPAELDQPLPRPVKVRPVLPLLIVAMVAVVFLVNGDYWEVVGPAFYKMQTLKEHGVPATGAVTNLHTSKAGRQTSYSVTYSYPLVPKPVFMATDQLDFRHFNTLHVGDAVPIAYDPTYPPRSLLNFDNIVFARNNVRAFLAQSWMVVVGVLCILVVLLSFIRVYWRQKGLLQWGKAAVATIVSYTEYNAGRAGRRAAVTYTFADGSGQIVQGKRKGLPLKDGRQAAMYKMMFENPTVLYDPADSAKNKLYPFALVACSPKPQPSVFSAP